MVIRLYLAAMLECLGGMNLQEVGLEIWGRRLPMLLRQSEVYCARFHTGLQPRGSLQPFHRG